MKILKCKEVKKKYLETQNGHIEVCMRRNHSLRMFGEIRYMTKHVFERKNRQKATTFFINRNNIARKWLRYKKRTNRNKDWSGEDYRSHLAKCVQLLNGQ